MMEYFVIALASFLISGISMYSGFGTGTVLMPVFSLFFPVSSAIALSAVVHFLGNIFKFFLIGSYADKKTIVTFGTPSIIGAVIGASLLKFLAGINFSVKYSLFGVNFETQFLSMLIGFIIFSFVSFEIFGAEDDMVIEKKYMPVGGLLSGFFGGLSGNQGIFRSIFLLKSALSKEQFVATSIVIACVVDIVRLLIYGGKFFDAGLDIKALLVALVFAFSGSYLASRYLKKVTYTSIKGVVAVFLSIISLCLILGLI